MEGINLITLLLLWLPLSIYGKFTITGPAHPVIAIVGEDATLGCQVMPSLPINNIVVRWLKTDLGSAVYMYRNGEDDTATQDPEYRGRTELFKNELTKGNISLKIKNTRVFDEGKYRCSVDDETEFEETVVELKVGGLGRKHWIQIEGNNKQGIQLMCESNGWFPKPKLMWSSADGQNLTAQSEINYHRDTQGLLTVQSSVTVTKDSTNSFKCLIQNNLLKKEQEVTIQIAELEYDKSIKQYDQWKSLIESDWKKISEYKVNVTLDTKTANPTLEISQDQKNVRLIRKERNVRDNEERLICWESVLGSEEFTSGSHYWEVEVVGNRQWNVGVAMESVERKEDIRLVPSGKVWTIGRADNQFQANSEEKFDIPHYEIPKKIGVYLSYNSGIVSFYSANTKSHLYSFTGFKFTEKLHPFFSTAHCNKWLRI
ncbi:butyrophilin subfamily 3 member A3-like isoform X2 [Hemiscyllium ocellatum]|uniref:butyrophilin subfamily 3 member A3-like isoform X2 n=1 Tax=Hemiscyllium ocellatum TaxID=170820 RepID=UPI002966C2B2|nr:butyrophilin subfamily 3 member A3-like isoform X2 [Hemiscyllium ocellatum]